MIFLPRDTCSGLTVHERHLMRTLPVPVNDGCALDLLNNKVPQLRPLFNPPVAAAGLPYQRHGCFWLRAVIAYTVKLEFR